MKSVFSILLVWSTIFCVFCADTLKIEIISRPKECKEKAKVGDKVAMHYDGKLSTGKPFDNSYNRKSPLSFVVGIGQVIPGWDAGVPGMCVGEKRKLTCPPEYAYGDKGFGDIIPPKSTLVFEVELMKIEPQTPEERKKTEEKLEEARKKMKERQENESKKTEKKEEQEIKEEKDAQHQHPDAFESVDKDKNGEISREEMVAYIKGYQDEEGEPQGEKPTDEDINNLVGDIFQSDDKNKDGVLSKEEYDHAAGEEDDLAEEMKTDDDENERDEL